MTGCALPRLLRSSQPRTAIVAGLAAIAIVTSGLLVFESLTDADVPPAPEAPPLRVSDAPRELLTAPPAETPLARFSNADGRYSLSYPADWHLTSSESRTKIVSRRKDALVSLGQGSGGELEQTTGAFLRQMRVRYRDVTVGSRARDKVAGLPAWAVSGEASKPDGTRLRWLTFAVRRPGRNLLVAIFTGKHADPSAVIPPTQQIVSSLKLSPPRRHAGRR